MSDDPFADLPDSDRTIMRPSPGGRAGPVARGAPATALRGLDDDLPLVGVNPLVKAASPLLAAAMRLRGRPQMADPDGLRRRIGEAVRAFEQRALGTGLDTRSLRAARYALCATIDDLVLSTPWGSHSAWTTQSLTSMFHNEVSGGERFFDILEQMDAGARPPRRGGRADVHLPLARLRGPLPGHAPRCRGTGRVPRQPVPHHPPAPRRVRARAVAALARRRRAVPAAARDDPALGDRQRHRVPGRSDLPRLQPAARRHLGRRPTAASPPCRPPGR